MPKQSLTKRTMVRIYDKTVVRWQQYVIDFTAGWSFGEQQAITAELDSIMTDASNKKLVQYDNAHYQCTLGPQRRFWATKRFVSTLRK